MTKNPRELLAERIKRVEDATNLRVPDRVPSIPRFDYFAAKYAGITNYEAFYNAKKWKAACKKTIVDFEPDMYIVPYIVPGLVLEALDCKQVKWPGNGVLPDHSHQFRDEEIMKANEYESFLNDPSDFALRSYLPRIYGALEPFQKLPPLTHVLLGYSQSTLTSLLVKPECMQAFKALFKAGREMQKWNAVMDSIPQEMEELGFIAFYRSTTMPPYDVLQNFLRGMRGTMLDIYKQPEKIIEACHKILPWAIQTGIMAAKETCNPRVMIPVHWGSEDFMSTKQFETLFFPTLKKLIEALVAEGLTPIASFEGSYTSRLEYLLELPKGRVIGQLDCTDIFKAKDVLKSHMCLKGNVPISLLQTGSHQEIIDYCKKLIDIVGKNGGFIIDAAAPLDVVRPEKVKIMLDFIREYGIYR